MVPENEVKRVVRLMAGDAARDVLCTGQLVLVISDEPVHFELTVPTGLLEVEAALPIFQGLSNLFVDRAVASAEAEGRTVTCRAGCGACCRQLVPISEAEAHALAHLVDAMPESRQVQVRQRFADVLDKLAAMGMVDRLREADEENRNELGMDYFRMGIACPFLEDESCSIHSDRPLSCREYLVTSPAQNCKSPSTETIQKIRLESHPSVALLRDEAVSGWIPLVFALRFNEHAPAPARDRSGPDILRDVIGRL